MKAALDHVHYENKAKTIISFWFKTEEPIDYIAGQFIEMNINDEHPDDRGNKRWFTVSSSPSDTPLISITTKFSDKGSSFKRYLRALRPGDIVNVSDPMGDFVLPIDSSIPLIFIAGGIGITPFHSIIKWLNATHQSRDISLLYAAREEGELLFLDLFEEYGLNTIYFLSSPPTNWDKPAGKLNANRIIDLTKPDSSNLIYISGPEQMVESLQIDLIKEGIDKPHLVGDFFPGYKSI